MNRGRLTPAPQTVTSYSYATVPGAGAGGMSSAVLFEAAGTVLTVAVTPIVLPLPSLLLLTASSGA